MPKQSDYARTWIIHDSRGALDRFLIAGDKISLVEHRRGKPPVVHYTVKSTGKKARALRTLTLFPRGHEAVRWPHKPLPPNRGWSDDLKALQGDLRVRARRLEGDFHTRDETFAVMMWIVEEAIEGDRRSSRPLLVIDLKSDGERLWDPGHIGESGTGTGDPG